ncbi:MAG TPA: transketolase C-terminal domain-containing protein, partial [Thermomicrobiales bacterium]|nr:transketolase C-terminal domain-containing protein [Thermomicrobiales bacterium]
MSATATRVSPLPLAGAEQIALREAWGHELVALAQAHPDLLVLDGDLANSTRADIFAAAVPERFFEMGIAEQNLLGVAAGLATVGFVPWISTFVPFLAKRALDQVRVVVAQPHLNVKMCGSYSGILTGKTGKTHQAVEDLAIFRAMPGVISIVPADAVELRAAMAAMMAHDGPMYLRLTRDPSPVVFGPDYRFAIGRAVLLRDGGDVGLVSTGVETTRALAAADLLAAEGISASLLHVPTLKPLDVEAIVAVAERTSAIVTAEDHSIVGGLGGAVAETLAERRPTRMRRIGWQDIYGE